MDQLVSVSAYLSNTNTSSSTSSSSNDSEIVVASGSPDKKKSRKSKSFDIQWNYERSLALLASICKHKAHKKTPELTMAQKMKNVARDLRDHFLFTEIDRETFEHFDLLDQKWRRIKKDVSKKFAISSEGANLSGFDEDSVSELEKLCITLLEDEMKTKSDKEAHKEAIIRKNSTMLSFESAIISSKERLTTPCFTKGDSSSDEKKRDLGGSSAVAELEFVRTLMQGREEKREKKFELEREKVELEKRKVANSERKVAAQEEQNACMNKMLMFLMQGAMVNNNK